MLLAKFPVPPSWSLVAKAFRPTFVKRAPKLSTIGSGRPSMRHQRKSGAQSSIRQRPNWSTSARLVADASGFQAFTWLQVPKLHTWLQVPKLPKLHSCPVNIRISPCLDPRNVEYVRRVRFPFKGDQGHKGPAQHAAELFDAH